MTLPTAPVPAGAPVTLDAIARPSGGLAVVAMDQRESLRHMFDLSGAGRPDDDVLTAFKMAVAEHLGPLASGFLIDRHYGHRAVRAAGYLPPTTGMILAADALTQQDGGPVDETALDEAVLAPDADLAGAVALKLLLIWRRDDRREARVELARRFVQESRTRGLLSVLEPVVRAAPGEEPFDQEAAIREAARELSPLGASLYKVQMPRGGRGSAAELRTACEELATDVTGPWVILSQGVGREDFHDAVLAACQAGASGFLAGRALWSDVVGHPDVPSRLQELSVPRLRRLVETVDEHARPWDRA